MNLGCLSIGCLTSPMSTAEVRKQSPEDWLKQPWGDPCAGPLAVVYKGPQALDCGKAHPGQRVSEERP